MPLRTLWFQYIERTGYTHTAPTSYREFAEDDRQSQNDKEQQIKQNKRSAPVFTCYIRKTPDISQSYGTSGRYQDEP